MLGNLNAYPNTIAPVRNITVKAVFKHEEAAFNGTYTQADRIQSFDIQRVGEESKFFGFGIVGRLNMKLRDNLEELDIPADTRITLSIKCGTDEAVTYPDFYVSRVNRDENTGQLSVTAYDLLYKATTEIYRPYPLVPSTDFKRLEVYIKGCSYTLNTNDEYCTYKDITNKSFFYSTTQQDPNFDGTETVKQVLDSIAEFTQTIYYMGFDNRITFRRLSRDGEPLLTIGKEDYFTLKSGENRRLQTIAHITELGDNISASTTQIGTTQYVRDNAWYSTTAAIEDRLQEGIDFIGDMSINQFECSWRGFPALEPGDKIALVTKKNDLVYSFLLNDTLEYNGGIEQKSLWKYVDGESNDSTPHTIGDVIREVYAKVDRVNKEISLVVSEKVKEELKNGTFDADIEEIVEEKAAKLEIDLDSITQSVMESTQEIIENELVEIREQVSLGITKDEAEILIEQSKTEGATSVSTTTGFTFNQEGLTVSKSGSDMTTTITEDGMTVFRDDDPVLITNNEGVKAEDLHATTYLIIGINSRFEDYQDGKRTGCFWIGN